MLNIRFVEYYVWHCRWSRAHFVPGIPTTNNALERLNLEFKQNASSREVTGSVVFLDQVLKPWMKARSIREADEYGEVSFNEPHIDDDAWRRAQFLLSGQVPGLEDWTKYGNNVAVPSCEVVKGAEKLTSKTSRKEYFEASCDKYLDLNSEPPATFSSFMKIYHSFYLLNPLPRSKQSQYVF